MKNIGQISDKPYPIWICDPSEGSILDCNDAACHFMKSPREAVLGRNPSDFGIAVDDNLAHIGPAEGPVFDAVLHRQDISWLDHPARLIAASFQSQPVSNGDRIARHYTLMKQAMVQAGCMPIEENAEDQSIALSSEIRAMVGLPADKHQVSLMDMLALVHRDDLPLFKAWRHASAETGKINEVVVRFVRPSGEIRYVRVIGGSDLENGGRHFGLLQDVTDVLHAKERADRSDVLIDLINDIARLGGWRRDIATEQMDITQGAYRICAMPDGPFDFQAFLSCFDETDRARVLSSRERVHRERVQIEDEYPFTALDGTRKWVRIMQKPVIAQDGQVIAVVGALQDISADIALRHQAEAQALRLQNIFENMPDAFFLLDRDLRFTYANFEASKVVTFTQGPDVQCTGKVFQDVFPGVVPQMLAPLTQLLRDGQAFTTLVHVPNTKFIRRVDAFATPDGVGMHHRDVTEESLAHDALRLSEERYRLAMKASQDVLFDWNIAEDILTWSDAALQHFGYDPKVFPRTSADWFSIIHPDDRDRMKQATVVSIGPDQHEYWSSEYRLLRADGTIAHVIDRSIALPGPDGLPARMIGTTTDMTDLREEEQRLRAIIDVAADTIYEYDPARQTIFFSDGLRTTFGHDWVGTQNVPTPWYDALHPEDRDDVVAKFLAFCDGNAMRWRCEYRMARADGSYAMVRESAVAIRNEDGKASRLIGSIEDVTDQRRTEERARQTDRIEAIVQLIGGVAHDFNNLLTVILGCAELIEEDNQMGADKRGLAAVIINAADRGTQLTSSLLAFAGKQPLAPRTLDTAKALAEVQHLLERTLPADIALRVVIPPDLWHVEADPAQLNAALLNLAVNARDAMPDGGQLLIECGNARLDEAYANCTPDARPGDFLRIAVSDTGTGMSPDLAAKAFEPFFTTKPRGKGNGMGLSMVRGFTLQSKGHVNIYTEPGHGTTVSMYLPSSTKTVVDDIPEPALADFSGKGEHVLIVEDNPLLMAHVKELVSGLGYRVSAAADASEALIILGKTSDLDLLFTDVVLPGDINGAKLAKLAVAAQPDLKVLFTSGYSENAIVHHGRLDPGIELLSKPYRRNELAQKLRQIIEMKK